MRNTQIQNWNTNTNTIQSGAKLQTILLLSADVSELTNGHSSGQHFPTPLFPTTQFHINPHASTMLDKVRVDYRQSYFCSAIVKLVDGVPAILWCNIYHGNKLMSQWLRVKPDIEWNVNTCSSELNGIIPLLNFFTLKYLVSSMGMRFCIVSHRIYKKRQIIFIDLHL